MEGVLPVTVQKTLDLYGQSKNEKWNFIKTHNNLKIFNLNNKDSIGFQGRTNLEISLEDAKKLLSANGEFLLQPHQQDSQLVLSLQDRLQIYHTKSGLKEKNKIQVVGEFFSRFEIQKPEYVIIVKQSVDPRAHSFTVDPKLILINKTMDVLHIIKDTEQRCVAQQTIFFQKDKNEQLFSKLVKENIINLSMINYEYQDLLDKLTTVNYLETFQGDINLDGPQDSKPLRSNSLVSKNGQLVAQLHHPRMEESKFTTECENIYFIPQDRLGWVDENLDPSSGAYIYAGMHDRLQQLNDKQLEIYKEFAQVMENYKMNANTLIRYLYARDFKIKEALEMFQSTLVWRRDNNVNAETMNAHPLYLQDDIHEVVGLTKWGHPIMYTKCCNANPGKFGSNGYSVEGYIKFHRGFLEDACKMMKGNVDQYLVIMDCYNLAMKNFKLQVMLDQFGEVFNYYPERQYKLYIINSNFVTRTCHQLLKPFIPKRTSEKLNFIGTKPDDIRNALLKEMDLSMIPMRYGGGNPCCK